MKNYVKPMVVINESLAESVYMASGWGTECYTVDAKIHQTPEPGRENYRIQFNAVHAASDGHHSSDQILTITFNQPVNFATSDGKYISGNGTTVLNVDYDYHNNANENTGAGYVEVQSEAGLAIQGAILSCNHACAQHTW